MRVYLGKAII